ncbi:MAG: hypothetical protein HKL80_01695, partial [Acidimicrobiales bacterium]|nr:hypothetical protein [Acidimicrobiales bacterium]
GYLWEEELTATRIRDTMEKAFDSTWAKAEVLGVSLRIGAVALAVEKIAEAHRLRGLIF